MDVAKILTEEKEISPKKFLGKVKWWFASLKTLTKRSASSKRLGTAGLPYYSLADICMFSNAIYLFQYMCRIWWNLSLVISIQRCLSKFPCCNLRHAEMRLTQILLGRYFRRYVERELTQATLRRQWSPINGWKEIVKTDWHYGEHRPWTDNFKQENTKRFPRVFVEPIKEWWIFKGDRVSSSYMQFISASLLSRYLYQCSL